MAKRIQAPAYNREYAFYEQLGYFYKQNRKIIRSHYNELTRKYLAYNDPETRARGAWGLRPPQFEALEMYVFIKEFLGNAQIYDIFDDWRNRRGKFALDSAYTRSDIMQNLLGADGRQRHIFDADYINEQNDILFEQMKQFKEPYPNYIYALTMGLGKTILIATCIFYEFLLANKYSKDPRFCHNALVFAPDKTVLESLREIKAFDKSLVMPPEYVSRLDPMIKFHYLDDAGMELATMDDSDFNIVISNNQKIIVMKKQTQDTPGTVLFGSGSMLSAIYGSDDSDDDDDDLDESKLKENRRFKKLLRLPQLGVYVDEAHHLFGSNLAKELRDDGKKKTSLRFTINRIAEKGKNIVACYNFTGTPYVENQVLPEVVYAYGLKESIANGYLKDAQLRGDDNVKSVDFLRRSVTTFWERYGEHLYDGLLPKLAIFAATIEEAVGEVRPALEQILADLNIPLDKILVNVGDPKYTKDDDIKAFNDLDKEGNEKQFIILVGKGREGWNCRSLFGVAMYRSPDSKIFVLQATMRCLRAISSEQLTASVFLSKENYDILDAELHKNFNMDISELTAKTSTPRKRFQVKVVPPQRKVRLKRISHKFTLDEKEYKSPLTFGIDAIDTSKYAAKSYEQDSLRHTGYVRETDISDSTDSIRYSEFTMIGEITRYLNVSPLLVSKIIREATDGVDKILDMVNRYNDVLMDVIIPTIFHALYEINSEKKEDEIEAVLLKEPKDGRDFYEFSAKEELVVMNTEKGLSPEEIAKSFHADTYCFDSKPERELFWQYIRSKDVDEIYFTGMFTSGQGDFFIQYIDPDSNSVRRYYPDFLARLKDGTYELIEVKGAHMIDNDVVKAKQFAAEEMSAASNMRYIICADTDIMQGNAFAMLHAPIAVQGSMTF